MASAKFTPEQREKLPPAVTREVDFKRDVKPILDASCIKCHGRGKSKGDFAIDTRETFLKGGESGPAVIPGKSGESHLIEMVSGIDPDIIMPQKGSKLTPEQVGILRKWIDSDLPWDESITFAKLPPVNLHPRKPELPESSHANPVDRFVYDYFKKQSVSAASLVDDRVFARRAYLDIIGLLPEPQELERFISNADSDKREKLVEKLLARDLDYAQHWLTFWNDALRNDYKGTGYIDGGRKQITSWLFTALAKNKPYDEFVAELINPDPESEGFAKGIVWRGVVNASQTPQMQAAQNISQVFMGVNLKCASCHDSFINDWTLADAYGLASVYSESPLEMFRCDVPTGQQAAVRFIYPELGSIDPEAPKSDRLHKLADIVTSEQNGRLTRTIVNRLWARFMGRGLVEPVDEMDHPSWNQDLLDWLAADLAENAYDLKHTMKLILTSRAYQLPTVPVSELSNQAFVFQGPMIRRLSAEQFVDAVAQVTETWDRTAAAKLNFAALSGKELKPNFENQLVQPQWIWSHDQAARKADPTTVYFRKLIELPKSPVEADLVISCDNNFRLFINGEEAGSGKDHTKPSVIDARKHLREGINLIAVSARNWPGSPNNPEAEQGNPAGLWLYARIRTEKPDALDKSAPNKFPEANVFDFGTDASWICAQDAGTDWFKPEFVTANWQRAAELGDPNTGPWHLGETLAGITTNFEYLKSARASLANNDPLMTALGRPNREQVVTSRATIATTLQALELTNGPTLAAQLKKAGQQLAQENLETAQLISKIYQKALGRKPTASELDASKELVGSPVQPEGVEDLLWAMTMLPEFQLIY